MAAARLGCVVVAGILILGPTCALADVYWSTSAGDWSVASNWGGTLPTSSQDAYIINGGTAIVSLSGEACGNLVLGTTAGNGIVQMLSGNLTIYDDGLVGYFGDGTFFQSGGIGAAPKLVLGYNVGSSGIYILSGTGNFTTYSAEYVGYAGMGTFTQTGGMHTVVGEGAGGGLYLGYSGGVGTYNLIGGNLSSNNGISLYNGSFNQSGGVASCDALNIGWGIYAQSGGTSMLSTLNLAGYANSSGTYSLSAGLLSVSYLSGAAECLGCVGTGTFTQSGGSNSVPGSLYVGYSPTLGNTTGNGVYVLSGTGQLSASNEYVGYTSFGAGLVPAERWNEYRRRPFHWHEWQVYAQRRHSPDHRGIRQRRGL